MQTDKQKSGSNDAVNDYLASVNKEQRKLNWIVPPITCLDGFQISVQASEYHYSSPRSNDGPWYEVEVEVGYPSTKPRFIMEYAEDPDNPTETVYGYVPIELVNKLIESHGGIAK